MAIVKNRHLLTGQTFATKDIVWMRIAEQANRQRIKITTELSNRHNLCISGENFCVQINLGKKTMWKVKLAAVRQHNPGLNIPIETELPATIHATNS